jgi:hypothetical protein
MPEFLNKPIKLPTSGPIFVVIAIVAIVSTISNLAKDSRYFGYYLLAFSIIITISGIGMAFSKKERERARATATADPPDRAALINAPNADKVAQRRGYYSLAVGTSLFIIWCWFFGLSTLATGV